MKYLWKSSGMAESFESKLFMGVTDTVHTGDPQTGTNIGSRPLSHAGELSRIRCCRPVVNTRQTWWMGGGFVRRVELNHRKDDGVTDGYRWGMGAKGRATSVTR
jgi:hypothetical protein